MHCFQTVEAGENFIYTIMIKYNHHISAEQPFHLPYHFHLSIDPLHDESFALKQIITKQHSAFIFTLLIAQQIYPTFAICFQALQCNLGNEINSGSNTFLLGFDMLVTYWLLRLENFILHKEYKMPQSM